jgi:molybdate transport system regulatory protein
MRLAYKIWIDADGDKTFGPGPARLLRGVRQTGSLRKAAAELGMSYNKAWWNIHTMEERLGFSLLIRSTGGATGGGSTLTPDAVDLLARFDALQQEAATVLEALYVKHFAGFVAGDAASPGEATGAGTPDGDAGTEGPQVATGRRTTRP